MSTHPTRRVLLVTHPKRPEAMTTALSLIGELSKAGIEVVVPPDAPDPLGAVPGLTHAADVASAQGCELVVVLGGDGTILRGAELARPYNVPLLGVNLGHVGFLAEVEREDIASTIEHIVSKQYTVEERLALEVRVSQDGHEVMRSWALNEISVEKAARERMIEVTLEIDDRPLSSWGCDGVVISTPTGSTAYAFSAGGPVVWPQVEAFLVVPLSAHALFARPLVLGPESRVAIEVKAHNEGAGVMWCDGRRPVDLPPGARIEVCRSAQPVLLARTQRSTFTDRLVDKFDLSVSGWRGEDRPN